MEDQIYQWKNCIQLLKSYVENYKKISGKSALEWLYEAIAKYPKYPPTMISTENEEIILEIKNEDYSCKLLFKNDGSTLRTDYFQNKPIEVLWL